MADFTSFYGAKAFVILDELGFLGVEFPYSRISLYGKKRQEFRIFPSVQQGFWKEFLIAISVCMGAGV